MIVGNLSGNEEHQFLLAALRNILWLVEVLLVVFETDIVWRQINICLGFCNIYFSHLYVINISHLMLDLWRSIKSHENVPFFYSW